MVKSKVQEKRALVIDSVERGLSDRVTFKVVWEGVVRKVTYTIDKGHEDWLVDECADGVLLPLTYYALRFGFDIVSKVPVSHGLLFSLNHLVIPEICNAIGIHSISVEAPEYQAEEFSGDAVGSGFSGGVDSFATFCEYAVDCTGDERISHLCYFKQGAHDGQLDNYDPEVEDSLFEEQLDVVRRFASRRGYPLVILRSNINKVLSECFGFMSYEWSHSWRNAGMALMLQRGLRRYYYSDTHGIGEFGIDLSRDSAYYEKWLLPLISTDRLTFVSANSGMSRLEKTRYISKYPVTYDNLLVCWRSSVNDCTCDKCVRTLVTLDYIGALDLYADSFDVERYRDNRDWYLRRVAGGRFHDPFFREIYRYAKENGMERPGVIGDVRGLAQYYGSKVERRLARIRAK